MAAAELAHASTKALINGIVVGYEIMIRVGRAIVPWSLNRGFHITGVTGPFGAAGAAANIMGPGREETIAAFGMAGLQASGLIQVNHEEEGSMVKPLNPARASMSGLLACILARKGAQGPLEIFEGEDGYLKAFTEGGEKDVLRVGVDELVFQGLTPESGTVPANGRIKDGVMYKIFGDKLFGEDVIRLKALPFMGEGHTGIGVKDTGNHGAGVGRTNIREYRAPGHGLTFVETPFYHLDLVGARFAQSLHGQ